MALAGLGWVGVGVKGKAGLRVWTFEGVGVSVREALVYDYATNFSRPGFCSTLPQAPRTEGKKGDSSIADEE